MFSFLPGSDLHDADTNGKTHILRDGLLALVLVLRRAFFFADLDP